MCYLQEGNLKKMTESKGIEKITTKGIVLECEGKKQ